MATYYLSHAGVKGMKWGVRKEKILSGFHSRFRRKSESENSATPEEIAARNENRKRKAKKAVKIGSAIAAVGLAAYGAYTVATLAKLKGRTNASMGTMDVGRACVDRITIATVQVGRTPIFGGGSED